MTVAATTNRKTYTGDNVTTSFATSPVIFYATSDLQVRVTVIATGVSTLLTLNTHYTVSGGSSAGAVGTVSLAGGSSPHGALLSTEKLVILRVLPLTQGVDFVNNNNSDAEVIEAALDKLTDVDQQIQEQADRSIRFASGDVSGTTTELPDVTTRAGRMLGFDLFGVLTTIVMTAGTSLVNFASSLGSSLIGFIQAGTGAVLRTIELELRDRVNVKHFGALGDGVTNDAAAIQAAQNYLETLAGSVVGAVSLYFPTPRMVNGFYLCNTKISVGKVCRWYGEHTVGTQIKTTSNGVTVLEVKNLTAPLSNPVEHFVCEDIYFKGSGAASTAPIVILENVHRSQFERCAFLGGDIGIQLKGGSAGGAQSSFTNTLRACRTEANNSIDIDAQAGSHILVVDACQIGSAPIGIKAVNCADLRVLYSDIEVCTTAGIDVDESGSAIAFNHCAMILGCHFESNVGRDIRLGATNVVNGANVWGNTFGSAAATKPVDAVTAANLSLKGNLAYNWVSSSLITLGTVTGYSEEGTIYNVAGAAAHAAGSIASDVISGRNVRRISQSGFQAQPTAQATNVTGDGTVYQVAFATERADQKNDFATPSFTAPHNGLYHFSTSLQIQGLLVGHTGLLLEIVTTARSYDVARYNPGAAKDAANATTACGTVIAQMTAGDTAFVQLTVSGGTKVVSVNTASFFSGYFL